MKKIFILLLLFYSGPLFSQSNGKYVFTIKVYDTKSKPLANTPVTLIETTTKERLAQTTNTQGYVTFTITSGERWAVNILQMKNCDFIDIEKGAEGTASTTITYDYKHYERTHRPLVDRSKMNLGFVDQTSQKNPGSSKTDAIIRVHLYNDADIGVATQPVNLTCYKLNKTFLGKTNKAGDAFFLVPPGNEYEMDVDGIESFHYVDVGPLGLYDTECLFEPSHIVENDVNDTIIQVIPKGAKATSSRVFVRLKINKRTESGINKIGNEDVYLQMLKTNKVYAAKTNSEGEAYFLLPLKRKYMVHFRYEKDVDVLNYSDFQGIANAEGTFTYTPDPRLEFPERYIPVPQDIIVKEFLEFVTKQFPEPPNEETMGLTLSWGNENVNELSKEAILQVGFKARNPKGNALTGPPINIALVIDKSGSMEGHERIDALKLALLKYIDKLRPTDIVSLIVFDDVSRILVPSQAAGDKLLLKEMIEDIQAGGGTNIYVGMVDGYEQVLKKLIPKGTNRVILLTDGYGSTPVEVIINKSKEYTAKGIEISAVGIGSGYNQAMLSQLASVGGGLLQFAGEAKEIDHIFEKEISSILSPCAKSANVEIIYNDKIIFKQLYGFPSAKKGNNTVVMKLDNLYSGINTLALVKFDLPKANSSIEKSPVIIRMSYFDLRKKKEVILEERAHLKWSESTGQLELILEAEHKKLYAIAILNQSLKAMGEAYLNKDYKAAYTAVQSTIDQVKNLYPKAKDEDVNRLVTQMQEYVVWLAKIMEVKKIK